jgi:flagellar hook protein FlgE
MRDRDDQFVSYVCNGLHLFTFWAAAAAMSLASVTGTALSGLNAAQMMIEAAADNLANQQTPGFRRGKVVFATNAPQNGVGTGVHTAAIVREPQGADIARDLVDLSLASHYFRSNLAVLRTSDALLEDLLNLTRR